MTLFQLRYRNSFIEYVEDDVSKGRRSQSEPPLVKGQILEEEDLANELGEQHYVESLSQKLQMPNEEGLVVDPSASASPEPMPEVGEELQLTPGSVGHPEICRRQCIYFQAGHCSNGDACTYCHLPHPQKSPKLDKRQRAILQALTHKELLALILHLCRSKAEEIGMWVEAKEVIAILEAEAGNTPVPEMAEREKRALRKSLLRMTFAGLISIVIHRPGEGNQGLFVALEQMRRATLTS